MRTPVYLGPAGLPTLPTHEPHLQPLDVRDELVLFLRHALVVHAVEVALLPEAVPGGACARCHLVRIFQLRSQRRHLLFQHLGSAHQKGHPWMWQRTLGGCVILQPSVDRLRASRTCVRCAP